MRRRPVTRRERYAAYGTLWALAFAIGLCYGDVIAFWWMR